MPDIVRNAAVIYQRIPEKLMVPGETTKYVESQIDLDTVPLGEGGFLVKTLALSSDPYLRGRMREMHIQSYSPPLVVGEPINNFGIAVVLRSEDPKFQAGDHVHGFYKFQTYNICYVSSLEAQFFPYTKVDGHPLLPWSLYVGILGMPGHTAYFGWKTYAECKALKAETLFVSAGAGAIGSIVIQLAKLANPKLKVISSAGSKEKVEFIKSIGADVAFNYKEESTTSVLDSQPPIDIYWDNVAGETLDAALAHMAHFGLIIACGAISAYNGVKPPIKNYEAFYSKELMVQGFLVAKFWNEKSMDHFHAEMPALVADSKIKYREHRYDGLENAEQALLDVHTGGNNGKAVIIVSPE